MATGIVLLALLLGADPAPGDAWPVKDRNLRIPIKVDPARRGDIQQLTLFSSSDQGKSWHQESVANPDADSFAFFAPQDGTYWFSVVVTDKKGNQEPRDIYQVPPSQKILIDTVPPVLRIVSATRDADEVVVNWEIQEDHLDANTLKLEYHTPDAPAYQWNALQLTPAASGSKRFRPLPAGPVSLRMQVQDQAGNQASATAEVAGAAAAPAAPPAASPAAPTAPPLAPPLAPPAVPSPAPNWDTPSTAPPTPAKSIDALPPPSINSPRFTEPLPPRETARPVIPAAAYQTAPGSVTETGSRLVASSENVLPINPPPPTYGSGRLSTGTMPPLQLVNTRQLTLDYEVTQAGPSGIGKVELFVTRDDGRTWDKFAEDPDSKPPMTIELPAEGVYGFRLVLHNRVGLSKRPPVSGDRPEMRIEADWTPPSAELYAPEPDGHKRNTLVLSWNASDRNLAPNPITLEYSEQRTGLWKAIGSDLPNTGHFSWELPPNIPPQVYLRLTVRDAAGNVSEAVTPKPETIDLIEPEGRLLGVAGGARK
jgi:hypothetical protein